MEHFQSLFKQAKAGAWTAHKHLEEKHTGFYPISICRPQYSPAEVPAICYEFKAIDNRVDFFLAPFPLQITHRSPRGLQTIGCKLLALIDELPPPPHSREKCLLVSYLNKSNILTPNNARENNGNRDRFRI